MHWESPEALKSLMTTFATAVPESDEVLEQLRELRARNDEYYRCLGSLIREPKLHLGIGLV